MKNSSSRKNHLRLVQENDNSILKTVKPEKMETPPLAYVGITLLISGLIVVALIVYKDFGG